MAKYDKEGREIPDPMPVEAPMGWTRPLSIHDLIKQTIRQEVSRAALNDEQESFEEANDFEVDEDGDPISPYEIQDAPVEWPSGEKDRDPTFDRRKSEQREEEEDDSETEDSASDRGSGKSTPPRGSSGSVEAGDEVPGQSPSGTPPPARGDAGERRKAGDGREAAGPRRKRV